MKLRDYFRGQKLVLQSPLPPSEAKSRINRAAPSGVMPWTVGVAGRIVGRSLRLNYRSGFLDYNAKPILAGRLEDDLGSTRLSAKFRAPVFAFFFFPFWYLIMLLMGLTLSSAFINGRLEPGSFFIFPILCLFAMIPIGIHHVFTQNAGDHLEEIVTFLRDTAQFEVLEVPSLH